MRRFKFPFAYEPKVNLKNTVVYSLILKQQLLDFLINKYKCIYVDPTLVVDNKNSVLSYFVGDRAISFDDKTNNSILSINSTQDNYLLLLSKRIKNENFISFAPTFIRDAEQTNLNSVVNWTIYIELSIALTPNEEYFTNILKEIYYGIVNLANLPELKKIYRGSIKKITAKDVSIIDAQKLENQYPTLSLEEGLNHYCNQHKFVIVKNNLKKLKSGKALSSLIPTAQDNDLSCGFYVHDDINDQPINLMNICKRPNGNKAKQQLLDVNPDELSNGLYDMKLFEQNESLNISLTINFSNLLFYLLDKVHLAEVVKSVWPDDFLDFVKNENIEIF